MRYSLFLALCLCFIFCVGCSYSVFLNVYPHLRTIHISPFENMTSEYALAQDFQNYLANKFQGDGRMRVATLSPDARIEGSVMDYREDILSYDIGGNVSEYRVSILFSITMTDLVYSEVLYENAALLISEPYSTTIDSDNPQILTSATQAQEKIFERVFDTIIKNTLESW